MGVAMSSMRLALIGLLLSVATSVNAADHLLGHKVSVSKYGGNPTEGKLFKLIVKAGQQGNPASLAVPGNPAGTVNAVVVEREGGLIADTLTAGQWSGLGTPPGAKGWKYRNTAAPDGGPVRVLLVKERTLKLVTKGAGSMPVPDGTSGAIRTLIAVDGERYCTEAAAPHDSEVAGKSIKTGDQAAPGACPTSCVLGLDNDGDRLDDCVETGTGVYVDGFDLGTASHNEDTDDDGIDDGDEVLGTTQGLDLPGMGVNPLRRDILVEYDWFDDSLECAAHSHQPLQASLDAVSVMFAAAPLVNPDGSTGINFIHDRGQGGPFVGGNKINDADGVLVAGVSGLEFQGYKSENFDPERFGYFHYTILPHRYNTDSGSSGQAEIFGDDMIVSLYCANSIENVAHTIVHELGHNLRLLHGGNTPCNYKPNYNSVMNYRYQFPGVDTNCTPPGNGILDYSYGDRLTLDENDLDENDGVCGAPSWDWNGNSMIESGVTADINSADDLQALWCGGTLSTLADNDDWSYLRLDVLPAPMGGALRIGPQPIIDCDNPPPMP